MARVFTGSNVTTCIAAVVLQAIPILEDAFQIYSKLQDLSNEALIITDTCIPAGTTFVLAVPCVLLEAALAASSVVNDVTNIITDAKDINAKAPAFEQEIQSCSAVVRNATTDVNNLFKTMETCVNNFVSTTR
jgi:hypothetical protein